ncbi:hypothetical protein AB0F18_23915 [Streptomyces sp. NPDC029216]|uniref:hypothetical protein n=1 Tax=Streptomyces sp. NPDC029216 TaxID=3154701 RepID=UPI00340C5667
MDELGHRHIAAFVTGELAADRGKTTLYRCLATLSSALGDAVRQHRLAHEAVRCLRHCHQADPDMADLFDFLIGTGMRKGEALGPKRACDHTATTSNPGTEKAVLSRMRERPPTS